MSKNLYSHDSENVVLEEPIHQKNKKAYMTVTIQANAESTNHCKPFPIAWLSPDQ